MSQLGFFFDSTKCIGCRTCMMACKDKSDSADGHDYRKVTAYEGGKYPYPWLYFISMSCNHCGKPKCVEVCPTAASTKRACDGIVVIDETKCIGCETCVPACPYTARKLDKAKMKMKKCNACIDLWANNPSAKPQCVTACGVRCLDFGDIDALKAKYEEIGEVVALPSSANTIPSFIVKPTIYGRK